jgi:PPM family protein phosphatase
MLSFGVTDTGHVRTTNEDAYAADDDLKVYVVADGMGGSQIGEVASRLAVDTVVGFIQRTHDTDEVSWPYGIDTSLSLDANRVRTAILLANRRIFRAAESRDDYTGVGTTIVVALVSGDALVAGHVGDSRLYLWSGQDLEQVTRDDSWAATMLAHPGDAAAAIAQPPLRNVLTNVLGARDKTDVHIVERPIPDGATLLLCTDGLHGALPVEMLRDMLAGGEDAATLAADLVRAALDRGSRDNVTALVVRRPSAGP